MAMDLYSPISSHSNQSSSSSSPQRPLLFPEDPAELLLDSSCHHSLLLTMGDQGSDAGYHSGCSTSDGLSPLRSPTSSVDDSCCLSPSPLPPPPETSSSLLLSGGLLSGGFSSSTDIPECFTFQQQQHKQPVTSQSLSGATTTTAMSSTMIPEEDQNQNQEVERKCSQQGRKPRSRYPGRKRQSASEREKLRMRDLTKALHYLRSYLPASVAPLGQTLTKIETLRLTIRYIDHLSAQLGTSQQDLEIHARRPTTNQTQGLHHQQQQQQQQQAQSPMERIQEPRLSYIQPTTHDQPSPLSSEEAFTFNNPQPISPMAQQTHTFIPQCGSPIAQGVQSFSSQYLQPSSQIQHFQAPAQAPLPNVYAPALGAFPTHAPLQAGSALDGFPSQMSPQSLHDCYQSPNAIPYAEDFCFPAQQLWVPSQQNMFYGLC